MSTESIMDELQLPTPDIGARRTFLIWGAEQAHRLDPMTRAELIEAYADDTIDGVTQSGMFTALVQEMDLYGDAKKLTEDYICPDSGATREEILDKHNAEITRIAAELVPSPAEYVADDQPLTSFDEPHDDLAGAA